MGGRAAFENQTFMKHPLPQPKNTPLFENEELARCFRVKQVCIKDESANPFGTIKDRRSFTVVSEAADLRVDKLALITSGNNGFSLGKFASPHDINVVCIVDKQLQEGIKPIFFFRATDKIRNAREGRL